MSAGNDWLGCRGRAAGPGRQLLIVQWQCHRHDSGNAKRGTAAAVRVAEHCAAPSFHSAMRGLSSFAIVRAIVRQSWIASSEEAGNGPGRQMQWQWMQRGICIEQCDFCSLRFPAASSARRFTGKPGPPATPQCTLPSWQSGKTSCCHHCYHRCCSAAPQQQCSCHAARCPAAPCLCWCCCSHPLLPALPPLACCRRLWQRLLPPAARTF